MPSATALSSARNAERDDEFYYLSFRMHDEFFDNYRDRQPKWGFPIGGGVDGKANTLGEHSWLTKYSRRKAGGGRERFWEGLRRVVEGMYSIQKDWAYSQKLPWSEETAHRSAEEAYDRAFNGKWSPPGRGLWMLGTELVNGKRDGSPLYNCSFLSTADLGTIDDPSLPFVRLMEESMLGIGCGFDVRGAGKIAIHQPEGCVPHLVADSREGWCESTANILRAFFLPKRRMPVFDYSKIRPLGSPIKGFGGIAPGPDPLRKLHESLVKLFSGRANEPLTSSDIVDVMNLVGKGVVSGNVRRSAEIALGSIDDDDFLELKNWEVNPERNGRDGWAHISNNSVIVNSGDDCSRVADRVVRSGEPGIYWQDIVQNYGRLADPADGKEYRTKGVNPCQPGWVRLLTPNGIHTMDEVEVGDTAWSEDGWVKIISKISAGIKSVYRYRTTAGFVDATEDHRVISAGAKVEVCRAISIDRLRGTGWGQNLKLDAKDVLAGLLLGDGSVHRMSKRGYSYTVLNIGKNDHDYFTSEVGSLIGARHGSGRVYRVDEVIDADSLCPLPQRRIPSYLIGNAGMLRGLYSANGSVVAGRVTLKTTSVNMRDDVQISLSALGIASYYTTNKPTITNWNNGDYVSLKSYDVNIGRSADVLLFSQIIGFIQDYKMLKLRKTIRKSNNIPEKSFPVIEKESLGQHEVWDITVDGQHHTYWCGGMNVSNCGEIPLENFEKCNLSETLPMNCSDLQDYLRTLKFAYLYSKSVTLLPVRWAESNEVMRRNSRIGTSMTGIAQFAEIRGWTELRRWQDKGYEEIRKWDRTYSDWLGLRESIRVTTVKPSGTVSLLFGATPGCHFPKERGYYVRTVREMKGSRLARIMEDAGYRVEDSVADPDTTSVIYMPAEGPDIRSESEVSIWEKTSLAATCQRFWSDNSVSVTITFRPEEANEIPAVLRAFDGQLKTVSFLPTTNHIYPQAPYQRVSRKEWDAMRARIRPVDWNALYAAEDMPEATGELYCSNDSCEIPQPKNEI